MYARARMHGLRIVSPIKILCCIHFCCYYYMYIRAQESCGSRGGRPGLPVPNNPYGLREHKAALSLEPADMNESPRHSQGKESFGNRRTMQWNIETYPGIKLRSIGLPFILSGGTLVSASTVRHCENVFEKLQGKDEYNQKKIDYEYG